MKTLCQILLFVVTNFTNSYFFFPTSDTGYNQEALYFATIHSFSPKNENSSGLSATIEDSVVEIFVPL